MVGVPCFRVSPFPHGHVLLCLDLIRPSTERIDGGMFRTIILYHMSRDGLRPLPPNLSSLNVKRYYSPALIKLKQSQAHQASQVIVNRSPLTVNPSPFLSKVNFPSNEVNPFRKTVNLFRKRHCYSSFLIPQLVFSAVCL